jgi:hypothetical protein
MIRINRVPFASGYVEMAKRNGRTVTNLHSSSNPLAGSNLKVQLFSDLATTLSGVTAGILTFKIRDQCGVCIGYLL